MKPTMPRGRIVGEFLLIVLGVLSALVVDTWIEARDDDKLRVEYETRLLDDLNADREAIKHRIKFFTAVSVFGMDTLDRIRSGEPVSQDALLAAYYARDSIRSQLPGVSRNCSGNYSVAYPEVDSKKLSNDRSKRFGTHWVS